MNGGSDAGDTGNAGGDAGWYDGGYGYGCLCCGWMFSLGSEEQPVDAAAAAMPARGSPTGVGMASTGDAAGAEGSAPQERESPPSSTSGS